MPDEQVADGGDEVLDQPDDGAEPELQPEGGQQQAAEPEHEVEEEFEPEWLDSLYEEPEPQPRMYTEPQPRYEPRPPPQPAPRRTDPQRVIEDPDGWLQDRFLDVAGPYLAPLVQELQTLRQRAFFEHHRSVTEELGRTNDAIRNHYKQSFRDPAMANPKVRQLVDGEVKAMALEAKRRAEAGDFTLCRQIRNPVFADALLYMAKKRAGYPDGRAPLPVNARGMAQPRVRQSPAESVDFEEKLGSDTVNALKQAYGNGWRKKAENFIKQRDLHSVGGD